MSNENQEVGKEDGKPACRIQSLGRASTILREIVRNREGIGLAHLSKTVGLHSSTTFHLVRTLVALGYVRQDKTTKLYRVGPLIFELASHAFDEIEMATVAEPFLDELALRTGETSHFAIRSGAQVMVVARSDGTSAFRMADRTGVMRPAHATALGKILLSAMDKRALDAFLEVSELVQLTPKTITEPERLASEIEKVRRADVAYDEGEFHPEIRCVAVPVRNFTGRIAAAVGLSMPIWRESLNDLQEKAEVLKNVANELSTSFGYSSDPRSDRVGARGRGRAANQ
ncbi:MAG TPA: IclR family transcriptional regulator [Kiloniellales bacterium]|nr:IclR family transcriptional regulator [Kiloniellales bacterium]